MSASPYDLTTSYADLAAAKRRRFQLPRLRAAAFGGGFGLLVVAIGLVLIGVGWNGMAGGGGEVNGVPNLNAQLPWLISGGILGLALVVFGAAMVVVHNARSDRARLEAKLDELVSAVGRGGLAAPVPYPTASASATAAAPVGVFLAGSSTYHQPSCRLVQGRSDVTPVGSEDAAARELRACRVCKPATAETLSR